MNSSSSFTDDGGNVRIQTVFVRLLAVFGIPCWKGLEDETQPAKQKDSQKITTNDCIGIVTQYSEMKKILCNMMRIQLSEIDHTW